MERSPNNGPFLCTLRELHDDTATVIKTINDENVPVFVTLRGRFIACIKPLTNIENLEGKAIAAAVAASVIDLDVPVDRIYTSEEMSAALGLDDNPTA